MTNIGQYDLYRADQRCAIKPVWAQDKYKTDDGLIRWFYETLPILERIHEARIKRHYNNVLWFSGEYDSNMEYRFLIPGQAIQNIPHYTVPVVINHTYDITEQRVSRLAIYKPNFDVVALHGDQEDKRLSAENIKTCIESVRRINNFDMIISEIDRHNMIFGEAWLKIEWDERAGEKMDGKHIGDVKYTVKDPFWVMAEPRPWADCKWIIEIDDIIHIEEAKKRWPGTKNLTADQINTIWGWSNEQSIEKTEDEVVVYRLLHKPTEFLENGLEARIVGDVVVEREDKKWRYSHGDFPYERLTDIDIPGRIFPISVYNHIIPAQHQYNKMTSMIARSITQMAHSKWFMVKGTCDRTSLGNSHTIVETNPGAPFPQMVTPTPMSDEIFKWQEIMRDEVGTMGAVQGVSRGQPPSNARAASMLRFYEENEMQRNGCTIDKHNDFIKRTYIKTGSVIQDYYPNNKKRLVREIGEDQRYDVYEMSQMNVGSKFDAVIQNSNGYSESMAGRMEEIGFLLEKIPGYLSNDQVADILGHKQPRKFYDVATAALRQAEQENSAFSAGKAVDPPDIWEDFIAHRRTHIIFMNTNTFKRMPVKFQLAVINHLSLTELGMYEMGVKNPAFASLLTQLPDFPRFTPAQVIPLPMPPASQPTGTTGAPKGPGPVQGPPKQGQTTMAPQEGAAVAGPQSGFPLT